VRSARLFASPVSHEIEQQPQRPSRVTPTTADTARFVRCTEIRRQVSAHVARELSTSTAMLTGSSPTLSCSARLPREVIRRPNFLARCVIQSTEACRREGVELHRGALVGQELSAFPPAVATSRIDGCRMRTVGIW